MRKILIYNFSYLFFHQKLFFMKYVAFFLKPIGLPEIELYRWSIIYFFKNGIGLSTIQTTRYFSPNRVKLLRNFKQFPKVCQDDKDRNRNNYMFNMAMKMAKLNFIMEHPKKKEFNTNVTWTWLFANKSQRHTFRPFVPTFTHTLSQKFWKLDFSIGTVRMIGYLISNLIFQPFLRLTVQWVAKVRATGLPIIQLTIPVQEWVVSKSWYKSFPLVNTNSILY